MYRSRRGFLHLGVGAAVLPAISRLALTHACAQAYPSRPVRIVVAGVPGSANDLLARVIGQWLTERLGQPFIVENRPGAGTNLGTEAVARANPDGSTLLLVGSSNAINATLYNKLNFDFLRDIAPVAGLIQQPQVFLVHPSVPARTIPEFIAYVKAHPGKISMASPGTGTSPHAAGDLFKMMAGVDIVHVPYRGGAPAITDMLAGRVQMMIPVPSASIEFIRRGALRPLAVTTATRWDVLPDIPAVAEFLPGYEVTTWFGIGAPRDTRAEIIETLNREINASLADAKMKARFDDLGGTGLPGTPAVFGHFLANETKKWAKVIEFASLKAE
jgi:tripartite-type tricarboxylate transporter receptor subunit TctC